MSNEASSSKQVKEVSSFEALVETAFSGDINALCWQRTLQGDFEEIVVKAASADNITVLDPETLAALELSEQGQLARAVLLEDYQLLQDYGAAPTLNIIRYYEQDEDNPVFPTDVYSFHADRSPVPAATFLCTYYGASSDILPNEEAIQKILVPETLAALRQQYEGAADRFSEFVAEHFYDLHYMPLPGATPINLGTGHLWRLAIDHPGSEVLPCIHRAPKENDGQSRLLLIC